MVLIMSADATASQRFFLRTVTLERFKAAFKPDPIDLRPFNVLIGRNGSGKSTLLEALQWMDTTMRIDARAASDRYFGVRDLINLRSESTMFRIRLGFRQDDEPDDDEHLVSYDVKVKSEEDGTPHIAEERLWVGPAGRKDFYIKHNQSKGRLLCARQERAEMPFGEPDRLGLSRGGTTLETSLRTFFRDWVFLRLSPNRLAKGSPARRKSFDPLLDEEGQNLPALLYELNSDQREDLIERVRQVLPGMRDVHLDQAHGRDTIINYALLERMPYKGRTGKHNFPIPSWMLSEGTRRITAMFALLVHDPPPSLLCVEEVENGLDPQTTILVLNELKSAADRGTQVLVTTHNPWLLDHVELADIIQARRQDGNTVYEKFADRADIKAFSADVPPGTRYVNEAS
jgi:predicted ATPase